MDLVLLITVILWWRVWG